MIVAIVQARMSSSRLPGKVLLPLMGKPMLARQIERIKRARSLESVIVATSTNSDDDEIASMCAGRGIECERGSLVDVLDRYYRIAERCRPQHIVRLTGDCPLTDPIVIDAVVDFACAGAYDYASNTLEPTFPDGLDVEVCTYSALERAWKEAKLPSEREHVTPYIKKHPDFFRGSFKFHQDHSAQRWTVDEPEDFAVVKRIYEALMPDNPAFGMQEIIEFIAGHPEIASLNSHFRRDEGYARSVRDDLTRGN